MKIKHAQYYLAAVNDKKYTEAERSIKLYDFFKGKGKAKEANVDQIRNHTLMLHNFFQTGEVGEFARHIKIGKTWYSLEPFIPEMEVSAFLELDRLLQKGQDENLHKIMAILYRPRILKIGSRYEIASFKKEASEEYEARAVLFAKEMDYKHALAVVNFFYKSTPNYLKH